MRLITVRDQDLNREYDIHFVIPADIETDTAVEVVNAAVDKVKEKEDYTFDDLLAILEPMGVQGTVLYHVEPLLVNL